MTCDLLMMYGAAKRSVDGMFLEWSNGTKYGLMG